MLTMHFPYRIVIFLASAIFVANLSNELATAQPPNSNPLASGQSAQETGSGVFSPEIYKVLDSDDAETRLMKELITNLQAECDQRRQTAHAGSASVDSYRDSLLRLIEAQLEFHSAPEDQRVILTEKLKLLRAMEESALHAVESGRQRAADLYQSRSFRIKAELALLRFEKAQAKKLKD